jgi:hypothetical protein
VRSTEIVTEQGLPAGVVAVITPSSGCREVGSWNGIAKRRMYWPLLRMVQGTSWSPSAFYWQGCSFPLCRTNV